MICDMFTLIDLPYAPDALAPAISAQTLSFHHGKHLQAYVDNLNKLLPGSGLEDLPLEEIVLRASVDADLPNGRAIFNNAGQVLNHNLYFTQFKTPDQVGGDGASSAGSTSPSFADLTSPSFAGLTSDPSEARDGDRKGGKSPLMAQIAKQWGTLAAFQSDFESKGVGLFGSGWVWLSAQADGTLVITQEPNAGNPVTKGLKPLLTFDVWEHAYYLDYQNRRAAHLSALWQIVDWKVIEARYEKL